MRARIAVIVGTRPDAIKLAPVIAALHARGPALRPIVIATAQHRELLDQVLRLFEVRPEIDLHLMRAQQPLPSITARAIERLSAAFAKTRPDLVLVQGDTTTSFAGALAAFYQRIPCGHVEAGLRTGDPGRPFPEEINRRLTSVLAAIHFCPTPQAAKHLLEENIPRSRLFITGNTVVDALREILRRPFRPPRALRPFFESTAPLLLVTAHRRESHGGAIEEICEALRRIEQAHPELTIVYPVHPNPRVRGPVGRLLSGRERIHLLAPLDYLSFVHLMRRAAIVLTDSGGIQEEAPSLGVPVLVMREVTERLEAVAAGTARLVGTDAAKIVSETSRLLEDPRARARMARARDLYGDGKASKRIAAVVAAFLSPRGLEGHRAHFAAPPRSPRSVRPRARAAPRSRRDRSGK